MTITDAPAVQNDKLHEEGLRKECGESKGELKGDESTTMLPYLV